MPSRECWVLRGQDTQSQVCGQTGGRPGAPENLHSQPAPRVLTLLVWGSAVTVALEQMVSGPSAEVEDALIPRTSQEQMQGPPHEKPGQQAPRLYTLCEPNIDDYVQIHSVKF